MTADLTSSAPTTSAKVSASRAIRLALIVGLAGLLLVSKIPLCPVAVLTGHPCPGCGLTRATFAALHGDFAMAHAFHPLVWLAAPLVAISGVVAAHGYLTTGRMRFGDRVSRFLTPPLFVAYVLLIALWIFRFSGMFGGPVSVDPGLVQYVAR